MMAPSTMMLFRLGLVSRINLGGGEIGYRATAQYVHMDTDMPCKINLYTPLYEPLYIREGGGSKVHVREGGRGT